MFKGFSVISIFIRRIITSHQDQLSINAPNELTRSYQTVLQYFIDSQFNNFSLVVNFFELFKRSIVVTIQLNSNKLLDDFKWSFGIFELYQYKFSSYSLGLFDAYNRIDFLINFNSGENYFKECESLKENMHKKKFISLLITVNS